MTITVLNTRPQHQAQPLTDLLQQHGFDVQICPTLQIHLLGPSALTASQKQHLRASSIWIATSVNALAGLAMAIPEWFEVLDEVFDEEQDHQKPVNDGLQRLPKTRVKLECLPANLRFYAIGKATAQQAALMGLRVESLAGGQNTQFDSESLLAVFEPALAPKLPADNGQDAYPFSASRADDSSMNGMKISLLSGIGGRDQLLKRLTELGADVTDLALYERRVAPFCARAWQAFVAAEHPVLLISSLESWQALWSQRVQNAAFEQDLASYPWSKIKVIVFSHRIAHALQQKGWPQERLHVVPIQSNQGILAVLESLKMHVPS